MEEGRVIFDASAYMLFEASGDSDAQHCDGALDPDSGAAEDDAQSCSYGSVLSDHHSERLHEVIDGAGAADDFRGADFEYCTSGEEEEDDGGGGSDEEDDGVVDQCCGRGKTTAAAAKSNGCEGSKTMNESEGDRLFWEACLAS